MLNAVLILALASASLVDTVKSGDRAAAFALIAQRADVNAAEPDGTTPLHWAVHHGDLEVAQRLIRAGAKVNVKNDYGSTPMSEAAMLGRVDLLEALLKAGADVESPNADGQTALMIVARTSRVDAARLLLKYGAKVNAVEQWRGQTALMWAVAQKQPAMAAELVKAGADVNARSTVNNWERQVTAEPRAIYRPAGGLTPLLYAAREGCVECARTLVDAGADVNLADPENISPLLMAVINGQWDTAQYLIKKGANPNKWDFWGRAPLYAAVDLNTIPRGGRPDWPSLDEATPLQVIAMLLDAGANPNAQLKLTPPLRNIGNDRGLDLMLTTGATPLLRAAKALDAAAIAALLARGADITLANSRGITHHGSSGTRFGRRRHAGFLPERGHRAAIDRIVEAADQGRRRHQLERPARADAAARGRALGLERRRAVPRRERRRSQRQGQSRQYARGLRAGQGRRQQPRRRAHRRARRHRGAAQKTGGVSNKLNLPRAAVVTQAMATGGPRQVARRNGVPETEITRETGGAVGSRGEPAVWLGACDGGANR